MRRVLFLLKSYVDGAIREAGTEHWISEHHALHEHMIDVETGAAGERPAPVTQHTPVFLDHSGDAKVDSSASGFFNPTLAEKAKDGAG